MIRFYLAITNNCNRACEMCSMFSRPGLTTFLSLNRIHERFDAQVTEFEVQLEGGEPMIHPEFSEILAYFNQHPRCSKIIITTNGTKLPVMKAACADWLATVHKPFVIKPSINSHLLTHDQKLLTKCQALLSAVKATPNAAVRFNVRRLKDQASNDESWLIDKLREHDLEADSNIWYFQRYGFGEDKNEYDLPFIVENPVEFHLIAPDNKDFGTDLIARSLHMKSLYLQQTNKGVALKSKIAKLKEDLASALAEEQQAKANLKFECACGKSHTIGECIAVQTHWYVPPRGCSEGDYWNEGEIRIICPTTDIQNRVLFETRSEIEWEQREEYDNNPEKQFKRAFSQLFKALLEDFNEDKPRTFNNYYFDQNMEYFGLRVGKTSKK